MKKISIFLILLLVPILAAPRALSFEPEKGFYAEYELYRQNDSPLFSTLALFKDQNLEQKFFYLYTITYKYQILDIKENTAIVRVCFEGTIFTDVVDDRGNFIILPFKRIYDVKVDLNTLEMVDENGKAWGKWIFWIPLGSYDKKEYTFMKNWNDHGEVKGWITGPMEAVFSSFKSSYGKFLKTYFSAGTDKMEDGIPAYPTFEEYSIPTSYNIDEGGQIKQGGYRFDPSTITTPEGDVVKLEPGLNPLLFYTDEGLLVEDYLWYADDFIDQKVGIAVLQLSGALYLKDCDVKNEILIKDPKPEYQKASFADEIKKIKELEKQYKKSNLQKDEKRSGEPGIAIYKQEKNENNTNPLYYVVPLIAAALIIGFYVFKEKR